VTQIAVTQFADRHIGPSADEQAKMLAVIGYGSRRELVDAAVPSGIRSDHVLGLPAAFVGTELHRWNSGARRYGRSRSPSILNPVCPESQVEVEVESSRG